MISPRYLIPPWYVVLKSSHTITALCCRSCKFHRTHYSFVDEFRVHRTPPHKEIKLQPLQIWRKTLLFRHVFRAHYALRTDKSDVTRWTGKTSSGFHCGFNFATDRTLKKLAYVFRSGYKTEHLRKKFCFQNFSQYHNLLSKVIYWPNGFLTIRQSYVRMGFDYWSFQ